MCHSILRLRDHFMYVSVNTQSHRSPSLCVSQYLVSQITLFMCQSIPSLTDHLICSVLLYLPHDRDISDALAALRACETAIGCTGTQTRSWNRASWTYCRSTWSLSLPSQSTIYFLVATTIVKNFTLIYQNLRFNPMSWRERANDFKVATSVNLSNPHVIEA